VGRAVAAALLALATSLGCIGDPPGLSESDQRTLSAFVLDQPPEGLHAAEVHFGSHATLVGYRVEPTREHYAPGSEVTVSLVWRCDSKFDPGTLQFTHLVTPQQRNLSNLDKAGALRALPGVSGAPLPPSHWKVGKHYVDELTFRIPDAPGPMVIVGAGFYRGKQRVPIRGPGGDRGQRLAVVRLPTGEQARGPTPVPELSAKKLTEDEPIVIDGRLGEDAWKHAASTGEFVDVATGRASAAATGGRARLRWDDEHLYVALEIRDRTVRGGFPAGAVDPHLWERDTAEIMIDPDGDGDGRDYYEIQIGPQNLIFDSRFDTYNQPRGGPSGPFGHESWSSKVESAVRVSGTLDDDSDKDAGYVVEARLPWSAFTKAASAPPKPADRWRMNFYAMENGGGVAWSPILGQGNFHRASRFGRVTFSR